MAPESYYFIFSILVVLVLGIYLANMVYYRAKGKNLMGRKFKPGTAEHQLMQKHSGNLGLAILGSATLLGVANLIFDIYRLLHLANQEYARFALVFTPVFVLLIAAAVFTKIYRQFGKGKNKKSSHKDNDSWLS